MEKEPITAQTPMREIEIFGIPALFTDQTIPPDEQISDMHYYEIFSDDNGETVLGTVLTPIPLDIEDDSERVLYDGDLNLDTEGEMLTPEEFEEKYLSPDDEPDTEEAYGKDE